MRPQYLVNCFVYFKDERPLPAPAYRVVGYNNEKQEVQLIADKISGATRWVHIDAVELAKNVRLMAFE